ncbi:MAG: class I SAM-dependent methyltransferase [Armatimonadetes bacterium]|nr:class I SAM-dependent methyltransferase [Armatimonadota bacterium]
MASSHNRWRRAQEHERRYWQERGDVAAIMARRKPHYEAALARITELLPERPVIADVGSGPTCWTRFLPGARVFTDPLMHSYVDRWGKQLPEGLAVAAAGEALPLRGDSCDLVFSVNAIDHCADPGGVVRECVRVVKPGGLVAISVYAHPRVRAAVRRLLEAFGGTDDPHPHSFTRDMLLSLIEGCGLQIVEVLELGAVSFRTRLAFFQRTEPLVLARKGASG